jgi:REP element-mobilizing transposase RayT
MFGSGQNPKQSDFPGVSRQDPGNANREIGVPRAAWHSRGYLPHFECDELPQHVVYHLADSLARDAVRVLESELRFLPKRERSVERRKRLEDWIDAGYGSCVLRRPDIADITEASLLRFDSQRYRLSAWVVMPNHVHALFTPMSGWTVARIVASWKKFTARKICDSRRILGEDATGPVWHREYWDRFIRDRQHLVRTIDYIHLNPVKARLVGAAESWRWSSAFPGNANLQIGG